MKIYSSTVKLINLVEVLNVYVKVDHENEKYIVKVKGKEDPLRVYEDWEILELDNFLYGLFQGALLS